MNAHVPDPHAGWASPGAAPPPGWGPAPPRAGRRWPEITAAAIISAVIAATSAAIVATRVARLHGSQSASVVAPVTVTAPPPASPPPIRLPQAEADRRTCNAWLAAGKHVDAAGNELAVIPQGLTITDRSVRDNPEWSAAVHRAAAEWGRAGDTLSAGIAPGTTAILEKSAVAAAAALQALGIADETLDVAGGNTFHVWKESADTVNVLCDRLAPQ